MRRWARPCVGSQRKNNAKLALEILEDRSLLSASGLVDPDYILVQFKNETAVQKVILEEGLTVEQALAAYQSQESVAFAEQDYRVSIAAIPNDTSFGSLYGLHNTGQSGGTVDADIDAVEAFDITTGSTKTLVAVIDTGIDYTHPDLYRNIWINQGEIPTAIKNLLLDVDGDSLFTFRDLNDTRNQGTGKITDLNGNGYIDGGDLLKTRAQGGWADGVSNDGDGYIDDLVGWDFANNDNNPFDDNGHGTHVAGTIGAMGNNGIGVTGVNWNVQMAGLKFLAADGGGSTSGATAALNYAVSKGIMISNNSWGGGGYSTSFYNALVAARNAGHIFVAAAGNNGSNNDTVANYPSNYNLDNVIAVAATDRNNALATFSNYGASTVDLAAPGVSIVSTYPGNRYASLSGTSMATPHVTGVIALVKSLKPGYSYSQIISQVVNNTDSLSSLPGKTITGGRLNAFKAVSSLAADTTGARILSVTPNATGANPVSSLRVTFNEAINASTFTAQDVSAFTGPNGTITVTGITAVSGSGNKSFDITFAAQSRAGTYNLTLGPDIRDLSGNMMDQDADGLRGETTQDQFKAQFVISTPANYTFSSQSNLNYAIPDLGSLTTSITVNQDIAISDLNVQLNLSHTYDGDLYITLISPTGKTVVLSNRRGGSGDNMNANFDDEATTSIANGAAPFNGSFRPDGALSGFDGLNARGTWQLKIADMARYDVGKLNFFSLTFQGSVSVASRSIGEASLSEATSSGETSSPDSASNSGSNSDASPFLMGTASATERVLSGEQSSGLGRFARLFTYDSTPAQWVTTLRQMYSEAVEAETNVTSVRNLMDCFEEHDDWEMEEVLELV